MLADKRDLTVIAEFLRREFPNALRRTDPRESLGETVTVLMTEMKETLESYNVRPDGGW